MKKILTYILCSFVCAVNISCGDDDLESGGGSETTHDEVSYYVYDVQYNQDVATLLSMLDTHFYILKGEALNDDSKTLCSPGVTYKDSLLPDATKPYYFGAYAESEDMEALDGFRATDYYRAKDFCEKVAPYLLAECQKKGIDVKQLHLQAHVNYYLQMVDALLVHTYPKKTILEADYYSIKKELGEGFSDEEVCIHLLASIHPLLIDHRRVNHWDPTTGRMVTD